MIAGLLQGSWTDGANWPECQYHSGWIGCRAIYHGLAVLLSQPSPTLPRYVWGFFFLCLPWWKFLGEVSSVLSLASGTATHSFTVIVYFAAMPQSRGQHPTLAPSQRPRPSSEFMGPDGGYGARDVQSKLLGMQINAQSSPALAGRCWNWHPVVYVGWFCSVGYMPYELTSLVSPVETWLWSAGEKKNMANGPRKPIVGWAGCQGHRHSGRLL